jgi:hypothetical protein
MLDPEEIEQRRAAGRARGERMARARERKATSAELHQAIDRAEAALALVIRDVESTTAVRERSAILRYDDWIVEDAQNLDSWLLGGGEDESAEDDGDEDDRLALACRFGGHTFALEGAQSIADIALDIAFQVQDDVTDEIWGAWPVCPAHQHPMSSCVLRRGVREGRVRA